MKIKIKHIGLIGICIFSLTCGYILNAPAQNKQNLIDTVEKTVNFAGTTAKATDSASISDNDILQNKMLNSIDYFNSAIGTFTYFDKKNNIDFTVDYKVRLGNNPSSYMKVINTNGNVQISICDGNNLERYSENTKEYTSAIVTKKNPNNEDKEKYFSKNRYNTFDNKKSYFYRDDPACMGLASQSLFSQERALGFLKDYNMWNITGDEKLLGYEVKVIEGKLNDDYSNKFGASKFKWLVEKNTGILLKEELFNSNEEVIRKLETTSFKLNLDIDNNTFKKDKSTYSKANSN